MILSNDKEMCMCILSKSLSIFRKTLRKLLRLTHIHRYIIRLVVTRMAGSPGLPPLEAYSSLGWLEYGDGCILGFCDGNHKDDGGGRVWE